MTAFFHGTEICDVGPDGTVAIPAFLNEAIGESDSEELLVAKHDAAGCLIGYAKAHLATLAQRNEQRRAADEARGEDASTHYRRMRRTFGLVDRLQRGADTIVIPAAMRRLGKIDRIALFVGTGEEFEIWNPDIAAQSDDASFRELAAFRVEAHVSKGVH